MIIFLYGPDDWRRVQKKNGIIAEFEKKYSNVSVGVFDLEVDGAHDRLTEFVRGQSIFEPAKLAVLENAFELDAKALVKLIEPTLAAKDTTILLCEREKPVKALAFLLEKPALTQKFETLEGPELVAFIMSEGKKLGLTLSPSAAQFLGLVYAGNSWALIMELQKLSALVPSGARTVEKKDLDALDLEAAPNYWALLNGMKSADGRTRLLALEKLFGQGDAPAKLFNILAAQAGEKTPRMAAYDLAVKSGKLDYEEALVDMVLDG